MATNEIPPSLHPQVFISYVGAELRNNFVSHLKKALKMNRVTVYADENILKGIELEASRIALVILSRRYTESPLCLDELVRIKERVEEHKLVVIPIFYNLEVHQVREFLKLDFDLKLARLPYTFGKINQWEKALNFVLQMHGFVYDEDSSDNFKFIFDVVDHVMKILSPTSGNQIEKSHDWLTEHASKIVHGSILLDVNPKKEADIVQTEAKFPGKLTRGGGLNLIKDDNVLSETNSDATSKSLNSSEINKVDSVNEENMRKIGSENSAMVIPLKHQVVINLHGVNLRQGFADRLVSALESEGVEVYADIDEKMGEDRENLFKRIEESRIEESRIEESRIVLVIFSSRYTGSALCLDELVKIKELMEEGKLVVIPIFCMVQPSQVEELSRCFGDDFRDLIWTYPDHHIIKWEKALKFIAGRPGFVLDSNSDEIDFIITIAMHVKNVTTQIPQEHIDKSHDLLSEQQEHVFIEDQQPPIATYAINCSAMFRCSQGH